MPRESLTRIPAGLLIMPSSRVERPDCWLRRRDYSGLSGTRHYVSYPDLRVRNVFLLGSQFSVSERRTHHVCRPSCPKTRLADKL
jgi:hypothetical protein